MIDDSFAVTFSRLKMAGETELHHELAQRPRPRRKRDWQIFERVRAIFIFLFCATILLCALSRSAQIRNSANATVRNTLAERPDSFSNRFKQSALSYQKEVDDAAGSSASKSSAISDSK